MTATFDTDTMPSTRQDAESMWDMMERAPAEANEHNWMRFALCKFVGDPDDFSPEVSTSSTTPGPLARLAYERAKLICDACPVKGLCLDHAVVNDERWAMWGGKMPHEIQMIRKVRGLGPVKRPVLGGPTPDDAPRAYRGTYDPPRPRSEDGPPRCTP